jgi:hypothetical protein
MQGSRGGEIKEVLLEELGYTLTTKRNASWRFVLLYRRNFSTTNEAINANAVVCLQSELHNGSRQFSGAPLK